MEPHNEFPPLSRITFSFASACSTTLQLHTFSGALGLVSHRVTAISVFGAVDAEIHLSIWHLKPPPKDSFNQFCKQWNLCDL